MIRPGPIVEIADFNGDGSQDLLWSNDSTGPDDDLVHDRTSLGNGIYADVEHRRRLIQTGLL